MFHILFFIICVCLVYLYYKKVQKRNEINRILKKYYGPPTKPIIGNAWDFGSNPVEMFENLKNIQNKYGPVTKIILGNNIYLIISEPNFVEAILSSKVHIAKGVDYRFMKPWLLNGLLLSKGSYWQKRRKIITPTFHFKILDEFITYFNSESDILVERLTKEVNKHVVDIYPYITEFALDSICVTAMGTSINAQTSPNNFYVQAVKKICESYSIRKYSFWKKNNFFYQFSKDCKKLNEALNIVHSFTTDVIKKRREKLLEKGINQNEKINDFGIKHKIAFLDLLLTSDNSLTNEDILEEVQTFMFAGHDTTSSAISFALYEIANNPSIQEKLVLELQNVFESDKFRQPTMNDLNNLKYLDLVIKETLRKYPTVVMFSRELQEDFVYKDEIIPKGVTLSIYTYHMHNNPNYYPNPEKFDPDRFLPENINKRHIFSYIPFSAGVRNCIGRKYAMFEMKAVISKLLRNFKLLPANSKYDSILSTQITLKPVNGVSIRLEKRNF